MKKKILYTSITILFIGLFGCKKLEDFGDTNQNPSATNDAVLSALLANAESAVGGYVSSTRGGLYCQYFSQTQYTDISLYSTP